MKLHRLRVCLGWSFAGFLSTAIAADGEPRPRALPLITDGGPSAAIVIGTGADAVERTALAKLQAAIQRDAGKPVSLPVIERTKPDAPACILLGTPKSHPQLAEIAARLGVPLDKLSPEGFLLRTVTDGDRSMLVIAGGDSRGVLYGVQEAIDQVITSTPENEVYVTPCDLQSKPALDARGTYCLTCWGGAPRYDRAAWEDAIDAMADAGMNRVMFWMDGLFRSQTHPGAFLDQPGQHYEGVTLDHDDVHRLIQFAHDRGMEFFLGSGVFAWFTAGEYFAKQFPDAAAKDAAGLCPSHPVARKVTREYLAEMIEVFPKADGYMLEIRDELGDCKCDTCQKPLDDSGSKQFGQSEMDFLEELTANVWRDHPKTRFIWLMGYANHNDDPMYYERLRTIGRDPRMEWLEVRMSWTLPTAGGERKPLREFSDRVYHWDAYYRLAPEHMQARVRQTVSEGLHGYLPAYEPGFANNSIYDRTSPTPFPVRLIPFCVTQFYYRAFTWQPDIAKDDLLNRAYRTFFTAEAPRELADDLLFMRQFMAAHHTELSRTIGAGLGPDGSGLIATVEDIWTVDRKGGDETKEWLLTAVAADIRRFQSLVNGTGDMARLNQIAERVAACRPNASARTAASLDLLQRAIDDIRAELAKCGAYVAEADEALQRIDMYVAAIQARTTRPADAEK